MRDGLHTLPIRDAYFCVIIVINKGTTKGDLRPPKAGPSKIKFVNVWDPVIPDAGKILFTLHIQFPCPLEAVFM